MKLKLKNKIEGKEFIEIKNFSWYVFKSILGNFTLGTSFTYDYYYNIRVLVKMSEYETTF